MNRYFKILCVLGLAGMVSLPRAVLARKPSLPDPTEDKLMLSAGFLSGHPDLRYRLLGLEEIKRGNQEDALRFFKRAAYYADKPSQGMVAEMLWNGQGTDRDPALAYAWMDLAAERGYEGFLGLRERYWGSLDESQRRRAIEGGQAVYAQYGDAAAQARLERVMRRERQRMTGSRTGFTGNLQIYVPGPAGSERIDGTKFFDERYWDPKQYQAWHDSIWMKPRVGRVTVGEIDQVKENGETPASRVPETAPRIDATEPATPQRDETGLGTHRGD